MDIYKRNNIFVGTNYGTHKERRKIMLQVTSREFRDKQASLLDRADQGEQVVIRRRGKRSYMLTPIYDSDITITPELQAKIDKAREACQAGECVVCNTHEELDRYLNSL